MKEVTFAGLVFTAFLLLGAGSQQLRPKLELRTDKTLLVDKDAEHVAVSADFPEPTQVADIVRYYALLQNKKATVEKDLDLTMTIHAPERMPKEKALAKIKNALEEKGLVIRETEDEVRARMR